MAERCCGEAAHHHRLEMVAFLLDQGADIHAPGCHFSKHLVEISPYCLALHQSQETMAQLLLSRGAIYDEFTAAYLGDLERLKALLVERKGGPPVQLLGVKEKKWAGLMHYAVAGASVELVRYLGELGVEVKAHSQWLLRFAYWRENWEIMEALIQLGADPNTLVISDPWAPDMQKRLRRLGLCNRSG